MVKRYHMFEWIIDILIITVGVFIVWEVGKLTLNPSPSFSESNNAHLADMVITKCSSALYKQACYDEEIPKLMDRLSMESVFDIVRLIQGRDNEYPYCHGAAHRIANREVGKNPNQWVQVINRCPEWHNKSNSGLCAYGCIHGVIENRFQKEILSDGELTIGLLEIERVCQQRVAFMDQGICAHGVGHLLMYSTGGDITRSIQFCDKVNQKFRMNCYGGVFMQFFTPVRQEDITLVSGVIPSKEQAWAFCRKFGDMAKIACWVNALRSLFQEEIKIPEKFINLCSIGDNPSQTEACYRLTFQLMSGIFQYSVEAISKFCGEFPQYLLGRCFAHTASQLFFDNPDLFPRAQALCKRAALFGRGDECYENLFLVAYFKSLPLPFMGKADK